MAMNKSDWILICDRLPEVDEDGYSDHILVSFENATEPEIGQYRTEANGDGSFYIGDMLETFLQYGFFVNAWMPLPECYRTEGEG